VIRFRMVEACLVDIRAVYLNVDEMPARREGAWVINVPVSIFIGPCCLGRNVMRSEIARISSKKGAHFLSNRWIELGLGDQRHNLMSFVTSCKRRVWCHQHHSKGTEYRA